MFLLCVKTFVERYTSTASGLMTNDVIVTVG